MQNKLIILSGPSGTGKTTLAKYLLDTIPDLEFSISACSREKRKNEMHGKHYYFLTTEQFHEKIAQNEFIEWEEVYEGKYYGTLKTEIERIASNGHHVIFDIDVKGGIRIKELYAERALAIIIIPPTIAELETPYFLPGFMLRNFLMDAANRGVDVIIINDKVEKTKKEIKKIVRNFLKE